MNWIKRGATYYLMRNKKILAYVIRHDKAWKWHIMKGSGKKGYTHLLSEAKTECERM